MITATPFFPILFLTAACILSCVKSAFQRTSESEIEERMKYSKFHLFFFNWLERTFPDEKDHPAGDFLSFTCLITLACYGMSSSVFLAANSFYNSNIYISEHSINFSFIWLLLSIAIITGLALCANTLFHIFALKFRIAALKLFSFIASLIILVFFVISFPFLWIERLLAIKKQEPSTAASPDELRSRLLDLLGEMEEEKVIEHHDRKMIKSVAQFGKLVVREIMVPRVDMICLSEESTAQDAYDCYIEHGYSRVPIYKDSIDHITGLLLYKDFMDFCFKKIQDGKTLADIEISPLVIPVLYAPENKRIRDLFNEIRTEKIHAAIVVNEYGCTEGLVTTEDILEELVGSQIQDEHDEDEELLFKQAQDKSWIVDARMSIVDVERELGISVPHHAEYETLAGFISWKMGSIPAIGTTMHEDFFDVRILQSDRRQIHKVKISLTESL